MPVAGVASGRATLDETAERREEVLQGSHPQAARPEPPEIEARLLSAALRCVARAGVAGTSLEEVAEEAGCSRATAYRAFPGGKEALLRALARTEVDAAFAAVAKAVDGAGGLEDALVAALVVAARTVLAHPAVRFLCEHEPEVLTARLGFRGLDEALAEVRRRGGALFGRFLGAAEGADVAEWLYRILVSYLACPADGVDLADEASAIRLVRRYVLPGVALSPGTAGSAHGDPLGLGATP
jgi:AcrR family transcriptional regulator